MWGLALAWLALMGSSPRMLNAGVVPLKPATLGELQRYLLTHPADVDQFRSRGPFAVATHDDYALRLTHSEHIVADLYLSASPDKAPLVILLHGYDNSKADHAYQALHLASWGIHCLAVQLPNRGQWVRNGRTLARMVDFIHRHPESIDRRIDPRKIILAGHSFGATSVAIALADRAPAAGGILLDPAAVGKGLPNLLTRIHKPVIVLGADESVFPARGRDYFYRFIHNGVAEVSIRGAAHEDAQFPLERAQSQGADSSAADEHQVTFVSALTSAAFSLASTGRLDYAWKSFDDGIKNGKFIYPRKK
ncbi:MAG TPA: alpha/beta hydrolase [Burkholderiales bacterium]|nr:alpha/beta hydrolase [Burkholderiales bacterium]